MAPSRQPPSSIMEIILQGHDSPGWSPLSMLGFSCKACGCLIMHSSSPVMFSCKVDCFSRGTPPWAVGCFLKDDCPPMLAAASGRSFPSEPMVSWKAFLFSGAFLLGKKPTASSRSLLWYQSSARPRTSPWSTVLWHWFFFSGDLPAANGFFERDACCSRGVFLFQYRWILKRSPLQLYTFFKGTPL